MAKYIEVDSASGNLQEVIGLSTSTGVPDANKIVETGSDGRLSESVMPIGIGADTKAAVASETLSEGDFVNMWNDGGTMKVRKATSGSTGKETIGFVLSNWNAAETALVYFEGVNTKLSGLTQGEQYFLGTVGGVLLIPLTASGAIVQKVGFAISPTEIAFEAAQAIILA